MSEEEILTDQGTEESPEPEVTSSGGIILRPLTGRVE
jgi:hypothetical protein